MSLTLKSDPSRPGGGYAILCVEGGAAPAAVAIEDRSSGLYLTQGGKWTKQPNYFDIEAINTTSARLGPEIVDHVEADTILALHAAGAGAFGILVWPAIRPSAGASSGYVIAEPTASNEAGITGEIPSVAAGASAATEAAVAAALAEPLPPPPPPISETRPSFAAPTPAAKGLSLRYALLIANGIAVLIIAMFLFRGTEAAKGLVCEPTGALHGVSFAHALVSCPEVAEVDPEQTAYNDYLQCLPGKEACAQIICGDSYLSGFTNGAHSVQVKAARMESQKSCQAEEQKKIAAVDFSAFSECMRITINVCNRSQCVDRYRYKLTVEPYASSLRQAAATSANDCRYLQEESAFADFNRCVAAAACDTARCASAFTSAFPGSAHVSQVLQTAENAARTCATEHPIVQQPAPPTPAPQISSAEQATRTFIDRIYYASSSQGEADGASLSSIYAPEVNFYGSQKSNAEIMKEKIAYNQRWDTRRFYLRNDSISVACNSSGQVCRAVGQVEYDFYSSARGKRSRGMSSFDFLIANSQSNPKVISESSKVEQRY